MALEEKEILTRVNQEFDNAMGAPDGEISKERALAWKYYNSEKLGNEVEGQSEVVTSDVADVVDGIMPSLLRMFTTADNLVNFDPVGAEDEPQAQQESDYVNHVFFKKIKNPFLLLFNWFFTALTQKNGYVKAWWDESVKITEESYEGLSIEEVAELLSDEELEPIEQEQRETELGTVHDIRFKRVCKTGRISVKNVAPENFRISSDSDSIDPTEARMVGEEFEITRSELISMGFSKAEVYALPTAQEQRDSTEEKIARYNKTDETDRGAPDKSMEMVHYREAHIKLDVDENGRSELRHIIIAGNKLLQNDPAGS
jgi:hypothetical protein